jgi:hypothetical protein
MTASAQETSRVDHNDAAGGFATLRQGVRISPELTRGWWIIALLALAMTTGRILVPIAVQQTIDRGLSGPGGADISFVAWMCLICAGGVLLTGYASYLTTVRLATNSETRPGDVADQGLPARARPAGTDPEHRAPGCPGEPGDLRRRHRLAVPAVRAGSSSWSAWGRCCWPPW